MSDSMWPHRRQPTRLPSLWDSPGKNTGVGCHFLLQCVKMKSESEVAQSCPTLSNPMDCSLPGFSIHGIFQAGVLEWGAIAFSGSSDYLLLNSLVFLCLFFFLITAPNLPDWKLKKITHSFASSLLSHTPIDSCISFSKIYTEWLLWDTPNHKIHI